MHILTILLCIHVHDCSRALVAAALREGKFGGAALNVSGSHVPHGDFERAVEAATGRPAQCERSRRQRHLKNIIILWIAAGSEVNYDRNQDVF